jgi:hypothetical protein
MNIEEFKQWVLSEMAKSKEKQLGYETAGWTTASIQYKSAVETFLHVYNKLVIHFPKE